MHVEIVTYCADTHCKTGRGTPTPRTASMNLWDTRLQIMVNVWVCGSSWRRGLGWVASQHPWWALCSWLSLLSAFTPTMSMWCGERTVGWGELSHQKALTSITQRGRDKAFLVSELENQPNKQVKPTEVTIFPSLNHCFPGGKMRICLDEQLLLGPDPKWGQSALAMAWSWRAHSRHQWKLKRSTYILG